MDFRSQNSGITAVCRIVFDNGKAAIDNTFDIKMKPFVLHTGY